MNETERANEPQPDKDDAAPPAAVEWMMQQAAAGQSPPALPAARGDLLAAATWTTRCGTTRG